ncbi:MAG: L-2,4-diaminobutyrate decarboxylase [Alphaproteobacteria bacterium MarineAlpha6_Bin4]|nr:MAG: L-2,4-diaminobutyrate decarboxylase [Alphaproteobacteria bacterium MarineAlpha6_Bin4]|tara:strand:- start:19740 stop:21206 length:1467 start_codon:yes stop_codon:yes gene_type:complete
MLKNKIQNMSFIDPNGSNIKEVKAFILKVINILLKKISNAEKHPPLPKKLQNIDKFNLNDLPIAESKILDHIKAIIKNSMNASNPFYLGHMDSLPTTMSIVGDIICSTINNNMLSKDTAPIITEIEKKITNNLAKKFNLGQNSGGVMLSGGSLSNIQAIAIARNRILGTFDKGLTGLKRKPYIFASEEAHTSIQKAAMVLGLGVNSVVPIETNKEGTMKVSVLDKSIKEKIKDNGFPFCIIATAGTTITGGIDDLQEISKIANKYKLWMHTDAVYGGALIFSNQFKSKLKGIENSDSIAFNPQKWLYITKTCSVLLLKNKKYFYSDFFTPLPYVLKENQEYHQGEITLQGTRYPDALKLWLSLQHLGNFSYSEIIKNSYKYTSLFKKKLLEIKNIKISCEPQMNIICFRYQKANSTLKENNEINLSLQKFLLKKHNIFFSFIKFKSYNFLRAVLLNPFFNSKHIKKICSSIREFTNEKKIIKLKKLND